MDAVRLKIREDALQKTFKTNPDVLLVNCMVNEIRPVTLGRKNSLFFGNHEAAQKITVDCSLLATCRNHDVNLKNYLNEVISDINSNSAPLTGCAACSLISDVMHNDVFFVVSYLAFLSPIEAVRGCRA